MFYYVTVVIVVVIWETWAPPARYSDNTLRCCKYKYQIKKAKVKFVLEQITKAQKVNPGKIGYPLNMGLAWPQDRPGRVRKIPPTPFGIRSSDRPARSESLYRPACPDPQIVTYQYCVGFFIYFSFSALQNRTHSHQLHLWVNPNLLTTMPVFLSGYFSW
jgi:hypothetical protein